MKNKTVKEKGRHPLRWLLLLIFFSILGWGAFYEIETSALQSWVLSSYAKELTYEIDPGPSDSIAFPPSGPLNIQRGYDRIGDFQQRLEQRGFEVTEQARFSPDLLTVVEHGIQPPYREPPVAGLVIRDRSGKPIYDATAGKQSFPNYSSIPSLITRSLLFIEDRDLSTPPDSRTNPVVNWKRFVKASLLYIGRKVGMPVPRQGGSTLATQMEKYRYSANGRTASVGDKLRQITGASLKVYSDGSNTLAARKQIALNYINTVPLAAAPGRGEIQGLAQGFQVWFGLPLEEVMETLNSDVDDEHKARIYRAALMLICSVRAPSTYLIKDHKALNKRVSGYVNLMGKSGILDPEFARMVNRVTVPITPTPFTPVKRSLATQKSINAVRSTLSRSLGVSSYYDLDRLSLEVTNTIDTDLQKEVTNLFQRLKERSYLGRKGLRGKRMMGSGDPQKMVYSFLLYEKTPHGNMVRVHVDSQKKAFDINRSMKLDLGSTAKLRTVVHYLDVLHQLYLERSPSSPMALPLRNRHFVDPLTKWADRTLKRSPTISAKSFLNRALERTYSTFAGEQFFTGGGVLTFGGKSNHKMSVRNAIIQSSNLPMIRLMRDLVRYHRARLPYDAKAVIKDRNHPQRKKMLGEIAEKEGRQSLWRYYKKYRKQKPDTILKKLLGKKERSLRHLILLYYGWHPDASDNEVAIWLEDQLGKGKVSYDKAFRIVKRYHKPHYTMKDYSYLLRKNPLELWTVYTMIRQPKVTWQQMIATSTEVRKEASRWLLTTKSERPRTRRLRIRVEQDAFARMTPYWQRLAYPFDHLVPSYATALGSSSDRPSALAEFMGILINDGMRRPMISVTEIKLAEKTPFQTLLKPAANRGEQVLAPVVAQVVRNLITGVVNQGTARRVSGAFRLNGKTLKVGGKTGTGDNRVKQFNRYGHMISSKAVNRTATFVFYIGDRYFGVITAFVTGREADHYQFNSSYATGILRLIAPSINARYSAAEKEASKTKSKSEETFPENAPESEPQLTEASVSY